MKKVFKFAMARDGAQEVILPPKADIISVGIQNHQFFLWAICDPDLLAVEPRNIRIFGTGHPMEDDSEHCSFIGTVRETMQGGDSYVWHVFELIELLF